MEFLISLGAVTLSIIAINKSSTLSAKVISLEKKFKDLEESSSKLLSPSTASTAFTPRSENLESFAVAPFIKDEDTLIPESYANNSTSDRTQKVDEEAISARVNKPDPFIEWLKDNWIIKLGSALVLIGFVWALNYAYQAKWLTDTGVSVLGIVFGAAILTFGFLRMRKFVTQGAVFMFLGTGLIMLTAYFMKVQHVIDNQIILIIIMLSVLAVTSAASVIHNKQGMSVATLLLALLVPAILSSGDNNYTGLYSYLLLVVIGTIWVVAMRRWRVLTLISLVGVCIYSAAGILSGFGVHENAALMFAFIFGIIFFITNTISLIRNESLQSRNDKASVSDDAIPDIISAALNVSMVSTFILSIVQEEWHVLLLTLVALVFVVGGFLIYKFTRNPAPFFVYSGISLAVIAYVTFLIFGDSFRALTVAYTTEIACLSVAVYVLTKNITSASNAMYLFTFPLLLLLKSISNIANNVQTINNYYGYYGIDYYNSNYGSEIPNNLGLDYLVVIFFMVVTVSLAYFYTTRDIEKKGHFINNIIFFINAIILLAIIWGVCQTLFGLAGDPVALIVYSIIGVPLYVYGANTNKQIFKVAGGSLIALTVLWLVQTIMDAGPIARILGFIIIGAVLLSSAFLLKKKN